ncbi:MAG: type II toxin-antitoxin system VapC family toxin [Chloroflexota bacterium]|nr:MAG: type II toxin-antitoxin system VapC family toxin [Chloroflexota bacterium]
MSVLLDTNVLIRHLTGDPPEHAVRATRFLAEERNLVVPDLVIAEMVYELESVYGAARPTVAAAVRSVLTFDSIQVADDGLLLRAIEVYEFDRLHFAESYLIAMTERTGIGVIASFDRSIDRVPTIQRVEPT